MIYLVIVDRIRCHCLGTHNNSVDVASIVVYFDNYNLIAVVVEVGDDLGPCAEAVLAYFVVDTFAFGLVVLGHNDLIVGRLIIN